MTIIKASSNPTRRLPLEIACLWYIEQFASGDGLFQSAATHFTEVIKIGERAVQQTLRDLVNLGYLEEVEPRRRDILNKFWIPATYRLLKGCESLLDDVIDASTEGSAHLQQADTCAPTAGSPLPANSAHSKTKDLLPTCAPVRTIPLATSKNVLDSPFSVDKVVGSNEYGVGNAQVASLRNTAPVPKPCLGRPNGQQCPNAPRQGSTLCHSCATGDETPKPPYSLGGKYSELGFDHSRVPFCPFCGGHGTVDWSTYGGKVHLEETCGEAPCKTARAEMLRNHEELTAEGWTKTAARRRSEFERHDELQAKREQNAKNSALYDDDGRYRCGQSYPCTVDEDGISQYDDDLIPDCAYCVIEQCWVTTSDEGDRFAIGHTCNSDKCNETREKVLLGQKEFNEAISEDESLTTREEAAV